MKALRSISILAAVISVLPLTAFGQVESTESSTDPETQKTFTISGNVGIPGVVLKGLPDAPRSNREGHYSAEVPNRWRGEVMPFKEGVAFLPEKRRYNLVDRDLVLENYKPGPPKYVIKGNMIPKLSGVVLQGLPGLPVSDEGGFYGGEVEDGWSGTVTPVKEGYRFNPPSRTYENFDSSMENQDYGYISTRPEEINEDLFLDDMPVEVPPSYTEPIVGPTLGSSGRPDVLVIPTEEVLPGQFSAVQEDMRVMNHILRSTLEENRSNLMGGVFTDYGMFFGQNGTAFDGLYIQGYGAVFFVESDFPLTLSSAALKSSEDETGEEDDNLDPVWKQARQQVMSPNRNRSLRDSRVQTDPDEILRKLITSLKHASNMHIQSDEKIIVTVQSREMAGRGSMRGFSSSGFGGMSMGGRGAGLDDNRSGLGGRGGLGSGRGSGDRYGNRGDDSEGELDITPRSQSDQQAYAVQMLTRASGRRIRLERPVLMVTIQVEKDSVDAFARGEIDFDTFRQSVSVYKY